MLQLSGLSLPPIPFPLPSNSTSIRLSTPARQHTHLNSYFSSPLLKTQIPKRPIRFIALANNNKNDNNLKQEKEEEKENEQGIGSNGDDSEKNQGSIFSNIRWGDLLLDPDPNNIVAVGLTGLLTWASVQVLWQLLFISLAILIAAVKYSFIAAVLLFILITLL
ncbi:uncharacterized protein LOC126803085 [Argentina anserina]|uniref:uncharacterized protein LOC126803085 n=1 Tax=Argentina anserina TaxID=57926 RepID=UPI0021764F3C|nr:uncharacterized protein LOC126803085 [Potentilla anserina]